MNSETRLANLIGNAFWLHWINLGLLGGTIAIGLLAGLVLMPVFFVIGLGLYQFYYLTFERRGTDQGLLMTPVIEGGDIIESLGDRVLGRIVARDVNRPGSDEEIAIVAGTMLDELWIKRLEEMGIDEIQVRSPITCETRHGICSTCYGRDLARGHIVNIGGAVGVILGNIARNACVYFIKYYTFCFVFQCFCFNYISLPFLKINNCRIITFTNY